MKKIFALVLAVTLTVSSGMPTFATELSPDETVNQTKTEVIETEDETALEATAAGQTITLNVSNGEEISEELDDALSEAREYATASNPYTVKVPKGTYKLASNLHIYSNTTLDVTGVTLQYSGSGSRNMLMSGGSSYNVSSEAAGYNGIKNVTILGGTWISTLANKSTIIRMAHGQNITLSGVTLQGGGCEHQVEVAAIDGFTVKNCTFKDLEATSNGKQEALQLDIACSNNVFKGVVQDGTVMKNVLITGCTFSNVPRGVGTHTILSGAYHTNITITGNTFKNVAEEAIVCLNYYNCTVSNNTITNCGAGVLFQYFKTSASSIYTTIYDGKTKYNAKVQHNAKSVISNNVIKTTYSAKCDEIQGIKVYGVYLSKAIKGGDGKTVAKGDYYVSGVSVTNNKITTAGHGIHLIGSRDCTVSGNTITGASYSSKDSLAKKYDGIFLSTRCKNVTIEKNTINSVPRNGIFVMVDSSAAKISNNKVTTCGNYGIGLYDNSSVTGNIEKNTLKNSGTNGIMVSTNSKVAGSIKSNTINKTGTKGITIYKKSTVKKIEKNTFTNVKKAAIDVLSIQNNAVVTGNTMKSCKDNGINIETGTNKYTVTASDNVMKIVKSRMGVHVLSGKFVVKGNTISGSKWPVIIDAGVKGTVEANTLKSNVKNVSLIMGTPGSFLVKNEKGATISKLKSSKKATAAVTIKRVGSVEGYEVQYSTDSKFQKSVKSVSVKNKAKNVVTLKKLKSKSTYYVRVRTYKTYHKVKTYSGYGKVKKITVK